MVEKNYSKREQDHYFSDLFKRMDSQDIVLGAIKEQTTKTNGRVSKLEWWKTAVIWGLGTLWTIIILLSPIIWISIKDQIKQQSHDAVIGALGEFNVIVK